jgi:hypothetical protein
MRLVASLLFGVSAMEPMSFLLAGFSEQLLCAPAGCLPAKRQESRFGECSGSPMRAYSRVEIFPLGAARPVCHTESRLLFLRAESSHKGSDRGRPRMRVSARACL